MSEFIRMARDNLAHFLLERDYPDYRKMEFEELWEELEKLRSEDMAKGSKKSGKGGGKKC